MTNTIDAGTPPPVNETTVSRRVSFFSTDETKRVTFPEDPDSYIEIKKMNEGARAKFQSKTSNDIKVHEETNSRSFRFDAGTQRRELLKVSVVGWDLVDADGKAFPYSTTNRDKMIDMFDPQRVDLLMEEIRELNPWMSDEDTVDALEKEIEDLQKRRDVLVEREAEKNA